MHEDHPSGSDQRSWLERLGKSLVGEPADRQQLLKLLHNAEKRHLIDAGALSMIEGALQVSDMKARDIMIPRPQMETLDDQSGLEEMLEIITRSGHSRFPVMSKKKDDVVGILLAKDLLQYLHPKAGKPFVLEDNLRDAKRVPESIRLNALLNDFRNNRNHMAIVMDEYGAVAGLVTIEDVLEQIVGEIDDEHDIDEVDNAILEKGPGRYTVKALTPIDELNENFGIDIDEDVETIGGLISKRLGRLPKKGDEIDIDGFHFNVTRADSRRAHLLEMTTDIPRRKPG